MDEHRRGGHAKYSPDCPECKRGAAKQRTHVRIFTRDGGELSVDIAGPYTEGIPVTDRKTNRAYWPRYMLVGAFTPFIKDEAKAKYEQEVKDREAAGLYGPVQLETTTRPTTTTINFVELIPTKNVGDTVLALNRMINRIENYHKCKAVYRLHGDRAHELTGDRVRAAMEPRGITVTQTAGHDSNANGRAERAVKFFSRES